MRSITVIILPRAAREIDEAARWWAEHGSPTLVDDAVGVVLAKIERFPERYPRIARRGRFTTTRKASVDPIGFCLYYRYDAPTETVFVRCFWHEKRRPPRL